MNYLPHSRTRSYANGRTTPPSPLRVWRTAVGLTQAELGRLSGVSRGRIIALERSRGKPRRSTALALAAVLDCEVADLWPELGAGER